MKKIFFSVILVVCMLVFAAMASAWPSGTGQGFPTHGTWGQSAFYSTTFAPDAVTTVDLGTKNGYYNIAVDQSTYYQFAFTKTSDNTALTCKARFGGYSSVYGTTSAGTFATSGVGPWQPGYGMKRIGVFGCASTAYAARPVLTIFKQK